MSLGFLYSINSNSFWGEIIMSKINEIQSAILKLEGGAFQKLFDQYLHKKYHFENIQPLGVQSGTNKTTKGIPDTYVLDGDKYVLICYGSVHEQPARKIQNDINNCLNQAKKYLDSTRISKIICGYSNSNISPKQFEELKNMGGDIEVELIGIGTLSYDIANNYRSLAIDHLQIHLDTHQIFDIQDFVISHDKSKTNAPIDTKFCFRDKELNTIFEAVKYNEIIVVSGPAGIGKTRLSLEICRAFEKQGWKVFCIRSNGLLLIDDLEDYLVEDENYLLFFDDANMVSQFRTVVDEIMRLSKPKQIRSLITVRDYAKKRVINEISTLANVKDVVIDRLSNYEIEKILKTNFNNLNLECIEKICQVSQGNVRLAVLAGKRAAESGLPAISNAEDIYKYYYEPLIERMGITKKDIILLGMIAIFGVVRPSQNALYRYLKDRYISKDLIVDSIEHLYELELIDIFDNEILRISDQSFGNYILYFIVHVKKWIILSDLIEHGIPSRTREMVYLIEMLLSLFRSDDLSSEIASSVNDAWNKAEPNIKKVYAKCFYSICPINGLVYLNQYVQSTEAKEYVLNEKVFVEAEKDCDFLTEEIVILTKYKNTDYYNDAIELLFSLYEKRPDLCLEFYHAITNQLFDKSTYRKGQSRDIEFVKLLWERCNSGKNYNFTLLFLLIASYILFTYSFNAELKDGRSITFARVSVPISDEYICLRLQILKLMTILYDIPIYHSISFQILKEIYGWGLLGSNYIKVCCSDFNELYGFLTNDDSLSFEKALILGNYKETFLKNGLGIDERFEVLEDCRDFTVYYTLTKHSNIECSSDESNSIRYQIIRDFIKDFSEDDYEELFKTCAMISSKIGWKNKEMKSGIELILSILEEDPSMLLVAVKQYLTSEAPFNAQMSGAVKCLLDYLGYDDTIKLATYAQDALYRQWLTELFSQIDDNHVDETVSRDYFQYQKAEYERTTPIYIPVKCAKKFIKFDESFLDGTIKSILEHSTNIPDFLGEIHNTTEAHEILDTFSGRTKMLIRLYFACDSRLFDFEKALFWELYTLMPDEVWREYIDWLLKNEKFTKQEQEIFERIWETDMYSERIDYTFSVLVSNKLGSYRLDKLYKIVFAYSEQPHFENRKKEWILKKLHEEAGNITTVNMLFDVVTFIYPEWVNTVILHYIKDDSSLENFQRLHPFNLPGGFIVGKADLPFNEKIKDLKELMNSLKGVEFLAHKAFLQKLIIDCEKKCKDTLKEEYCYKNIWG